MKPTNGAKEFLRLYESLPPRQRLRLFKLIVIERIWKYDKWDVLSIRCLTELLNRLK